MDTDSDGGNGTDQTLNYLSVSIIKDHPILIEKSQLPGAKDKKSNALKKAKLYNHNYRYRKTNGGKANTKEDCKLWRRWCRGRQISTKQEIVKSSLLPGRRSCLIFYVWMRTQPLLKRLAHSMQDFRHLAPLPLFWYTLGCVLRFINAAMMTAVQHAVQYDCVSKSAISSWRILHKYKLMLHIISKRSPLFICL